MQRTNQPTTKSLGTDSRFDQVLQYAYAEISTILNRSPATYSTNHPTYVAMEQEAARVKEKLVPRNWYNLEPESEESLEVRNQNAFLVDICILLSRGASPLSPCMPLTKEANASRIYPDLWGAWALHEAKASMKLEMTRRAQVQRIAELKKSALLSTAVASVSSAKKAPLPSTPASAVSSSKAVPRPLPPTPVSAVSSSKAVPRPLPPTPVSAVSSSSKTTVFSRTAPLPPTPITLGATPDNSIQNNPVITAPGCPRFR